jgi:phosphate transport system substrate-binding protein
MAAAQNAAAPPVLRIAMPDGANGIFQPVVAAITAGGPQPEIQYGSPLGVLRSFCQATTDSTPTVALTQLRMPLSLARGCLKNGVTDVAEVELARRAVVLAVKSGGMSTRLSRHQVYLALARDVPDQDEFRRNLYIRWSDIDRSLPAQDIRFQLPPRDDGLRLAFDDLVLQAGCRKAPQVQAIYNAQQRTARCVTTRTDRVREIPRDQAVRGLLDAPEGTIGVLTYQEVADAGGRLVALTLDGMIPGRETIAQGSYDVMASYWLYARRDRDEGKGTGKIVEEIERIITQAQSDDVMGPSGALASLGLVPLSPDERAAQRNALADTSPMSLANWVTSSISSAWSMTGMTLDGSALPDTVEPMDFTSLMDLAGYKLKSLASSVGVIPSAGMTFGIAREMSDADRAYLVHMLDRDERQRVGIVPAMQRRVVRAVLNASAASGFAVSSVEIDFFPLPGVNLVISPTNEP